MVHYMMCGPRAIGLSHQAVDQKGIPFVRLHTGCQSAYAPWVHDPVLLIEGGQTSR